MKDFYQSPEMDVILFEAEDIIITSSIADKVGEDIEDGWGILQ